MNLPDLVQSITKGTLFADIVRGTIPAAALMGPTLTAIELLELDFDTSRLSNSPFREIMTRQQVGDCKRLFHGLDHATGQHYVDIVMLGADARDILAQVKRHYKTAFRDGVLEGIASAAQQDSTLEVTPEQIYAKIPFIAEPFMAAISGARIANSGYLGRLTQGVDTVFDALDYLSEDTTLSGIVEARVPSLFGAYNLEKHVAALGDVKELLLFTHDRIFDQLRRRGVRSVIAETQENSHDALAIAQVAQDYEMELLLSLNVVQPNLTASREKATDIFKAVLDKYGNTVRALGINCSPYTTVKETLGIILKEEPNLMRLMIGTWINGGECSSATQGMENIPQFSRDLVSTFMEKYDDLRSIAPAQLGRLGSCCCATGPKYFREIVKDMVKRHILDNRD